MPQKQLGKGTKLGKPGKAGRNAAAGKKHNKLYEKTKKGACCGEGVHWLCVVAAQVLRAELGGKSASGNMRKGGARAVCSDGVGDACGMQWSVAECVGWCARVKVG